MPYMMYIGKNGRVYDCECTKANVLKHMRLKHSLTIEMENGSIWNVNPCEWRSPGYLVSINHPKRNGIYLSVRQDPNGFRTYSSPAFPDYSTWWC